MIVALLARVALIPVASAVAQVEAVVSPVAAVGIMDGERTAKRVGIVVDLEARHVRIVLAEAE